MLLTIDVGNTMTAAALFRGRAIAFRSRLPTPRAWSRRHGSLLLPPAQAARVTAIIVSSVVPRLDRPLAAAIRQACGLRPLFVDQRTPTGIALEIDRPAELGSDRIADCAGALALFSPPLVVIDSGTATTFDLVNAAGAYCGGCILPGVGIAIQSLADHTAKLKRVVFSVPRSPVGTNTADGIRAGIFFGYVGALQHLISCYRKELGRGTTVVATGGLVRHFRGRVAGIDAFRPDLIFHGLRRIHEVLKERDA
jgi:type III pantothenate kinase